MASVTAATGGGYVPPFAATTTSSLSFAAVASHSATGTATAAQTAAVADATGGVDSDSLLEYFTRPYLDAHTLSIPTWRYAYILWIVIAGTLALWSAVYHLSGTGKGGTAIGAWFRKWSIRRITWTRSVSSGGAAGTATATAATEKSALGLDDLGIEGEGARTRKKVVWASPTLAQTLTVLVLVVAAVCLSFIGDDYIAPTTCTFGGECGYQQYGSSGPPKTNYRVKRGVNNPNGWVRSRWFLLPHEGKTDLLAFPRTKAPFNDPLLASSNTDIAFNAWSAAARLGLVSFAMLPLAVTLALKQWPFNIWASPFLTNYHFDKTAILHRWSGRVIWAFSTGHAIGWFWQLAHDKDPFGRPVLVPIWAWYRFCAGAAAWALLTILTAFSFKPIRTRFYELFYWSHVLLVVLFLAACIVHHPPLLWWPTIALIWWGAERLVRLATLVWINGLARGIGFTPPAQGGGRYMPSPSVGYLAETEKYLLAGDKGGAARQYPPSSSFHSSPHLPLSVSTTSLSPFPLSSTSATPSLPPPGFASLRILPGRTVRLTLHVPCALRWAPGQHVLLYVPQVRPFDSHPYTVASVDGGASGSQQGGAGTHAGSEIVLLIRAQAGFSQALYSFAFSHPNRPVRALVSAPMGSAGRVRWDAYETLLVVCGGTGVSFGVAVLEAACRGVASRREGGGEGKKGRGKTTRVRFMWIMREFAHLSWVAPTLRRCMALCTPDELQVDLYVTHDAPRARSRRPHPSAYDSAVAASVDELAPPTAPFARSARAGSPSSSVGRDSLLSELSDADSDTETASIPRRDAGEEGRPELASVDSVTDFVLFDGEEDYRTPAEADLSAQLKKEGKLRRALSRRNGGHAQVQGKGQRLQNHECRTDRDVGEFEALPLDKSPTGSPALGSSGDLGGGGYGFRDASAATSFDYPNPCGAYSDVDGESLAPTLAVSTVGFAQHAHLPPSSSFSSPRGTGELALTPAEQADLDAVAERARTGYPRLRGVLDEEVDGSAGKTVVACCGPSSLNTVMRNLVARKIDLKRVSRGDLRGQVALVVEDFSF
ncbi:hypothetical protein JCM10207_008194 [Rhodosporidiobolus poonsookiae]